MKSRYDAALADALVRQLSPRASEPVALRTYTARLVGSEPSLVLHGGGNTSVKATATTLLGETIEVLHVKGSGWDLATIEPQGHPAVRLAPLRKLRALPAMTDEAMVNELRTNLLDAAAPNPSVETLLHALLPARFIDHTHADAILAICDQAEGERICAALFGRGLVWIPYVMPGFALAKRCAEIFERVAATHEPSVMVLEQHGLFTWGATAKESYERTIEAVTRAEEYVAEHAPVVSIPAPPRAPSLDAQAVLPRLRGAAAKLAGDPPERGPIVRARSDPRDPRVPRASRRARSRGQGLRDPRSRPAHQTDRAPRPGPLVTTRGPRSAPVSRPRSRSTQRTTTRTSRRCARRRASRGRSSIPGRASSSCPVSGACALAATAAEADAALDLYEHTIDVMTSAAAVGAYEPVSRSHLFDIEYWSLEQAKLKAPTLQPLSRCIALVTGAASGIGAAVAAGVAAAGAHVAVVDRDAEALARVAEVLGAKHKARILPIAADVRDPSAVERAVARTVSAWGGLDLVVSNAGAAPEGRLETAEGQAALRDSLDLNCLSHATVAGFAAAVMRAQGRGGCLLFNASKSAFNVGPGFGPYAVAKSALVALMRQYAVDLGPSSIRSNAVNADRIRTRLFAEGVAESRARARGLSPDEYFRANLLGREVTATDVADAFVYLATARATTGCVVTVDGGNAAAFPR